MDDRLVKTSEEDDAAVERCRERASREREQVERESKSREQVERACSMYAPRSSDVRMMSSIRLAAHHMIIV